jgi:UDP-glucose 4-epimerase
MEADSSAMPNSGAMSKVLITGGAGFIGSTVASACLDIGITPVILDNLVTGRAEFARGRNFYEGDIADGILVDKVFSEHPDIDAVVHCAALIVVPDSVTNPVGYYRANVAKSLDMVAHLVRNGCRRMLFSSSAAIYAPGADHTVDENSPIGAASPYARTKAVCEDMFADIAAATPLRVLSLRYFNPIGADPELRTGLQVREPTHALGQLILAQQAGRPFHITGTDFPTRDGTGIRDYIHVDDLASAHVLALTALFAGGASTAYNVGVGHGFSVQQVLDAVDRVVGRPVPRRLAPRRPGDPARLVADSTRIQKELGWQPAYTDIDAIVTTAWRWHSTHPDGYGD